MKSCILIIEDNEDIRESSVEILELSGYEVLQAANGKAGVDIINKRHPDLILCDIMMPELDGLGVLYMLNKNPDTAAIPFIFLTAKAERMDIRKGMELGADDYLTKPFDDMELLLAVETRLAKKKKQEIFYSKSLDSLETLVSQKDGLEELKKTIAELRVRKADKSQVIYHEGDVPPGIFLVLSGTFKTTKLADDGRELITGIYAKEDYIGINSVLLAEPFSETAQAMEEGTYCLIPKDAVDELVSRFTDIGKKFIQILSNNIREKEEQLLQMAYHSVRKRMSEVLISLMRQQPIEDSNECLKASRDEMASMAGMAAETVSRILSDFTSEKLIEKKGRLIRIINKERLAKLKN
ncbi:MAG: response regulator [Bacteroidota bacterium]|nr:response regulator [Bacteroidota bacterium]